MSQRVSYQSFTNPVLRFGEESKVWQKSCFRSPLHRNRMCAALFVYSLMSACSGPAGSKRGASSEGPLTNKDTYSETEFDHSSESGEVSEEKSAKRPIIGSGSCSVNGVTTESILDDSTGDSKDVTVCCVNLDTTTLEKSTDPFISVEGTGVVIKPTGCEMLKLSRNSGPVPSKLTIDLSGKQKILMVTGWLGLSGVKNLRVIGSSEKTEFKHESSRLTRIEGSFSGENLIFKETDLHFAFDRAESSIDLKNVEFQKMQLNLIYAAPDLNCECKTRFENVLISPTDKSPLRLDGFPFNTDGIVIGSDDKHPAYVELTGYQRQLNAHLKQNYPVLVTRYTVYKKLSVEPGSVLWAYPHNSYQVPMFRVAADSELLVEGSAEKRIRIEPFPQPAGLPIVGQYLSDALREKFSIKLAHVDVNSINVVTRESNLLVLDDVNVELKHELSRRDFMRSNSFSVEGTQFVLNYGGETRVLSGLKVNSDSDSESDNFFFAYTYCGRVEGIGNVEMSRKGVVVSTPVVLQHSGVTGMVVTHCTRIFHDAGRKQVLHHSSSVVAVGAQVFAPAESCYFRVFTKPGFDTNVTGNCHTVDFPRFEGISITSAGHVYWSGNFHDTCDAIGCGNFEGPRYPGSPGYLDLKDPSGNSQVRFLEGSTIEVNVPENEFHNAFSVIVKG